MLISQCLDQYEKYCHRIESTSDWGGQLEVCVSVHYN